MSTFCSRCACCVTMKACNFVVLQTWLFCLMMSGGKAAATRSKAHNSTMRRISPLRCLPFVIVDGISIFSSPVPSESASHFSISNHLFEDSSPALFAASEKTNSLMEIGFFFFFHHSHRTIFPSSPKSFLVIEMQIDGIRRL